MELAMHCRDSDDRCSVRASYGSEWTVGVRHCSLTVAFPVSVRQQVLEPSDTPLKKVAGLLDQCYSLGCASSDPTEVLQHMPSRAGFCFLSLS